MTDEITTTYRLVDLDTRQYGQTALTPELAKLSLSGFERTSRIGLERTDWDNENERPKPFRTILIDAETSIGQWPAPN